ncbi:integrase [Clostridia bacterium]|nr:integrase [Clostridia bacterium]
MNTITAQNIREYLSNLATEEKSPATIEKYACALRAFAASLSGGEATKEAAIAYKERLKQLYAANTVNGAIAALNGFFRFMRWGFKIKPLKIVRSAFLPKEKELTKAEYARLLAAAKSEGNERLNLVMQAICSTGIRVSELQFFTVEAAHAGQAEVTNKGKTRPVFMPAKLKAALLAYAKRRGISSGCIFITAGGKPLDRKNIWADMKKLCRAAGVEPSKVFPHNLRALFARTLYGMEHDIAKLADLLGHSSIDTTRIYIRESGEAHRRLIEKLGLVTE